MLIRRPQPTARGSAFEEHWITKVLEFQSLRRVLEVRSLGSFFFDSEGDVRHSPVLQGFHLAEGFQTVVLEVQSLDLFFFDSEGDVRHFPVSQGFHLAEGFQTVVLEA